MTDLVIRPLVAGEEALFDSLPDPGLVGFAAFGETYREMAAAGEYRPEWTLVALREDTVLARAAWWGGPADTEPKALDWFDFTDPAAAAALLRAAPWRVTYSLRVPPGWREHADLRRATEARIDAATAAGYRPRIERYRYHWTPADGLPERPGRLAFRPEPDDSAILAVFRQVHRDDLDARVRELVAGPGLDAAARDSLEFLRWLPSPREWWRLAYTTAGELVGLTVPARNHGDPLIGYIGVVPAQRGHGYGYDLLVEATHRLVGQGADRIVAGTDVSNAPMAAHFAKAGYPVRMHRIDLV